MASELTTDSYINHHLTNLKCGKTDAGWTCDPYAEMGFWSFHVDSLLWSIILGCVFLFVFKKATPKKTTAKKTTTKKAPAKKRGRPAGSKNKK